MFTAHENSGLLNLRPGLRTVATGFVALAGILAVLLAARPAEAAQPSPSVSAVCNIGGQTTASWSHLKVIKLQVEWEDAINTILVEHPTFAHATPNGDWSFTTPANPTSLHVDFYTDTTENSITIKCT